MAKGYTSLMGGDSVEIAMAPKDFTRILKAAAVPRGKIELKEVLDGRPVGDKGDIVAVHIYEEGFEDEPLVIIESTSPSGSLKVVSKYGG